MTIRPRPALLSALLATASLAVAGFSACGKDKPAEEAEPAKVEAEPAGGAPKDDEKKPEEDGGVKVAGDAGEHDAATDPKSRRPARDRLTGRRPPPVRPGGDLRPDNGEEPGAVGGPSEPGAEAGMPTPNPVNPADPAAPPAGEPGAEPTAPSPDGRPPIQPMPSLPVEPALAQPEPASPPPGPAHDSSPRPLPVAAGAGPNAEALLPLQVVTELLGNAKLAAAGPLPGISVQPGYSSYLYTGPDASKLGVSLQVWQDPARRESDDRFRRMRLQYPKAEDVTVLPPAKAFFAHFSGVQILTFVDSVKRVVASVACGEGVCTHDQLVKLAKAVRERL